MALSQNPILRAAGFKALPKTMTSERTARIGEQPVFLTEKAQANAEICIEYYNYIQNNLEDNELFREVFKNFYLRQTRHGKKKWSSEDYNTYFNKLFSLNPGDNYPEEVDSVATYLNETLTKGGYQLSFGSKLVHTNNANCPIYDSGVKKYLNRFEGVRFSTNPKLRYAQLCAWYDNFIQTDPRYESWVRWFDTTFPQYSAISNVKKIDFVLFLGR